MEKKRIGILTGGGDCAGLNPAIKWVVKTALDGPVHNSLHSRTGGKIDVFPCQS